MCYFQSPFDSPYRNDFTHWVQPSQSSGTLVYEPPVQQIFPPESPKDSLRDLMKEIVREVVKEELRNLIGS